MITLIINKYMTLWLHNVYRIGGTRTNLNVPTQNIKHTLHVFPWNFPYIFISVYSKNDGYYQN